MGTVFLLKRPGLKVLPYLQVEDIIMDAGDVEALGDRLGLDRGGPIYRCQDTVELFTPLIREKVAKSAEGGLELGNCLLPGMAFYLHQEGGIDLPIGVGQYVNFQMFAILLCPHPGGHYRHAKPLLQDGLHRGEG